MENKAVCSYCGTIYDAQRGKCPLCGSSVQEEMRASAQRRRSTEEERRQRRQTSRAASPREERQQSRQASPPTAEEKARKKLLTAAMTFLALSVLVMLFFIGDMIGWWPGLENLVDRDGQISTIAVEKSCTVLRIEPESVLIAQAGQTQEMKVIINATCDETVYCNSGDENVVTISTTAQTTLGTEEKSAVFTLTGVGDGETTITVKCGTREATCAVVCGDPAANETQEPTVDPSFEPRINFGKELTLTRKGEAVLLEIEDLPVGVEVVWSCSDESILQIGENGVIVSVAPGRATVTAKVGGKTAELLVNCDFEEDDIGAHLQYEDVTIAIGETLGLYLYDADGERITNAEYEVEDTDICEVEDCVVVGRSRGMTNVIVTYHGEEYTCIVRVTN